MTSCVCNALLRHRWHANRMSHPSLSGAPGSSQARSGRRPTVWRAAGAAVAPPHALAAVAAAAAVEAPPPPLARALEAAARALEAAARALEAAAVEAARALEAAALEAAPPAAPLARLDDNGKRNDAREEGVGDRRRGRMTSTAGRGRISISRAWQHGAWPVQLLHVPECLHEAGPRRCCRRPPGRTTDRAGPKSGSTSRSK